MGCHLKSHFGPNLDFNSYFFCSLLKAVTFVQAFSKLQSCIGVSYCAVCSVVSAFDCIFPYLPWSSSDFIARKTEYCHYYVNVKTFLAIMQAAAQL